MQSNASSKASWNMWVHMPILRLAFSSYRTILIEPALSAKIESNFVPTAKGKAAIVESSNFNRPRETTIIGRKSILVQKNVRACCCRENAYDSTYSHCWPRMAYFVCLVPWETN
ncbi:Aspartate--tRNA ligase, cytoplasmic [Fusarium oxysporum f. sp. albedinis]|nr:Aspartate--tRNA ligase, cytoplasmic [Fusarium oxysporum f. sp. albedinis]